MGNKNKELPSVLEQGNKQDLQKYKAGLQVLRMRFQQMGNEQKVKEIDEEMERTDVRLKQLDDTPRDPAANRAPGIDTEKE